MALHRYGDFRVEVFYFDSPCMIYCCGMNIWFYAVIIIIIIILGLKHDNVIHISEESQVR